MRTPTSPHLPPYGRRARTRGGALITSLLAMTVMMLLFTALTSTRVLELKSAVGAVHSTYAQQIAEAGIHHVIGLIARDEGTLPATTPLYSVEKDYAGGRFTASADLVPATGQVRITSRGVERDGIERTIEVLMSYDQANRIVENFGMTMCGNTVLGGTTQVADGDLYVGGDLTIEKADAIVNGDALAYGSIGFSGQGSVRGDAISETGSISRLSGNNGLTRVYGNAHNREDQATLTGGQVAGVIGHDPNVYDMPDWCQGELFENQTKVSDDDFLAYKTDAMADSSYLLGDVNVTSSSTGSYNGERYIAGSMAIGGTPPGFEFSGTYFVEGDLVVTGPYAGDATFVVMGNVVLEGNMVVGQAGEVKNTFVTNGNARIAGGAVLNGVIYANGVVEGEGGATVNGSVVGLGIGSPDGSSLSGTLSVNYRPPGDDSDLPNLELVDFEIDRWRLLGG